MEIAVETPRMQESLTTNAVKGRVVWSPIKSLWYSTHLVIALIGGYLFFSLSGLLVFLLFTATSLCLGHSLGMHRRLIHNSYECPLWLEYVFVHLGVLVGMAGPLGMTYQHDLRDWAQRKNQCHSYLRHGESFWRDAWWQLHCDLKLEQPPEFKPEDRIAKNRVYLWMEKTWMLQQLPWAALLFYLGGSAWVIWGISARVAVSVTGHWLIGYFAHNQGERDWHVKQAAVQGYNLPWGALITMGESWHNNHHAFPGSAALGLTNQQLDPGWMVLNALHNLKLVWNIKLPEHLPVRPQLIQLTNNLQAKETLKQLRPCRLLQRLCQ